MKRKQNDIVIVLGHDHTNSLGIVQTLGDLGYYMVAFVWGQKTGLLKYSRYLKELYGASDVQSCINLMIEKFGNSVNKIPIIPCCDNAALTIEQNKERLEKTFLYEYSKQYSLKYLAKKENQVRLATEANLFVPKTWNLRDKDNIPNDIIFPCLIKPLISSQGAKSDIRICKDINELHENLSTLKYTKEVLIQQYIERDYEISILGCGLKNGDVIIPCVENKLTLYPKNVGLECLAYIQKLEEQTIIGGIKNLIESIGYVGVFSVEMMHCKLDGKLYFTEINLRNDGANSFIVKYGVNLPAIHIDDLFDNEIILPNKFNPGFYLWEMHHYQSWRHHDITFKEWFGDIIKSKGFLTTYKNDYKPFLGQFKSIGRMLLHLPNEDIEYYS